jgi:hypothetical protein
MKTRCCKCKKLYETGLKYKSELPSRPFCEECTEKMKGMTLEERWDFKGEK